MGIMRSHVDPRQTLGFALKRLQQALRSQMDGALAAFELTSPQYAVLALLAEQPGISNAELARRSFVAAPTMIRIITTLEEAGLLTRGAPPVEGRIRGTELTDQGRARLTAAAVHVQRLEDLLTAHAAADLDTILEWLRTSADDLESRRRE